MQRSSRQSSHSTTRECGVCAESWQRGPRQNVRVANMLIYPMRRYALQRIAGRWTCPNCFMTWSIKREQPSNSTD